MLSRPEAPVIPPAPLYLHLSLALSIPGAAHFPADSSRCCLSLALTTSGEAPHQHMYLVLPDPAHIFARSSCSLPGALRPLPLAVSMDVLKQVAQDQKWPPGWAFDGRKNLFTTDHILDWNMTHNIQVD